MLIKKIKSIALKAAVLIIALFSFHYSNSQVRSFSPDNEVFITEFLEFIEFTGQPAVVTRAKEFKKMWENDSFTDIQKTHINRLCNNMRIKEMPVEPYFKLVIETVLNYKASGLSDDILKQWRDISNNLLKKGRDEDYLLFLETSNLLFEQNGLNHTSNRFWRSSNNKFKIIYDKTFAIQFDELDLTCEALGDKIQIYGTSGTYYPAKKLWVGKGGKITWERVLLDPDTVYAILGNYQISLNSSDFTADSVTMYNLSYFSNPIQGKLIEKVSNAPNPDLAVNSSFPKFRSYAAEVEIKGLLGKKAKFKGGFSMDGAAISGTSEQGDLAIIEIYYKDRKMIEAKSKNFKIVDGVVTTDASSFEFFTDSGSIFHPKVLFNFNSRKGLLKVTKGKEGLMRVPFSDDYHKLEIDVQQILWNLEEPFLDFDMSDNNREAKVESSDFYREFIFEKVRGRMGSHPLTTLRKFSISIRNKKFSMQDYAAFLGSKKEYILETILNLHDQGFIFYYPEEDSIFVKKKLFNYVAAFFKVRDYDNIRMSSVIGARTNMTLNIQNYDLNIEGVRRFTFSDSQFVVVVPHEQQVTIKRDRKMIFGGQIRAGRFDLFSEKFEFDYGDYTVNSKNIDSMRIFFPDEKGVYHRINSVLTNISGTLFIDKPLNKSGLKDYPEYPKFTSYKGSIVDYQKPSIHDSQYKKETFHFEVDPFTIDSMDNFTKEQLRFDGTFKSAGIFPEFRNQLTIQEDYSLGFKTSTPAEGYPMYGGKGKADMALSLSNRGFYGSGDIEYLTSTTESDEFLILPEKTLSHSKSFHMPEGPKYPLVAGHKVYTEWVPKEDYMNISKEETNFKVFQMNYDFNGNLTLSPPDLRGQGSLEWDEAIYTSNDMVLERNKALAEHGGIQIYAADKDLIAFESDDTKGFCDFTTRMGEFASNVAGTYTRFPLNKYISNMADYTWDMDKKTIAIEPGQSLGDLTPEFVSVAPGQDSLRFESRFATFDLTTGVLDIEQVPFIDIADSRLFPHEGLVTVRQNAYMDTLKQSKLIANRDDKFHNIYNCNAFVRGKYKLNSNGYYIYTDKLERTQEMYFDSIIVKKADTMVVGYGHVPDSQYFTLDEKIQYKGLATVNSKEKPILFEGYVIPNHSFTFLPTSWVKFKDKVDPQMVIVNVSDPRSFNRRKLEVGLFYATDTTHYYPVIFDRKRRTTDPNVQIDTGIMFYDHNLNSFMIGDEGKLTRNTLEGNYMQLNESDFSIYTEGKYDFEVNFLRGMKFASAGNATLRNQDSTFRFNLAFAMDFPLPKEVSEKLFELANKEGNGTTESINNNFFHKAISELLEDKEARKTVKRIKSSGKVSTESIVKKTQVGEVIEDVQEVFDPNTDIKEVEDRSLVDAQFLIANSNWYFDHRYRMLLSNGDITIASMNGKNVNKSFKCSMSFEKRRSGDRFDMYLEFSKYEWVYINYVRGVLYVFSSDNELNNTVYLKGLKLATNTYKLRKGSPRGMNKLLDKFD
jgi:hypothetical protein